MFSRKLLKGLFVITLFASMHSNPTYSNDRAIEAENLNRLIVEINLIRATAERMREETRGDSGAVRFKYDALDAVLGEIANDIRLHLQVMSQTPRFDRLKQMNDKK